VKAPREQRWGYIYIVDTMTNPGLTPETLHSVQPIKLRRIFVGEVKDCQGRRMRPMDVGKSDGPCASEELSTTTQGEQSSADLDDA